MKNVRGRHCTAPTILSAGGNGATINIRNLITKTLRIMKLMSFFIFIMCLQAAATGTAQISIVGKNIPIPAVLKQIGVQSGMDVIFADGIFNSSSSINISVKNAAVKDALNACLKERPFTYEIMDSVIVIKPLPARITDQPDHPSVFTADPLISVKGRILNENNEPVVASVIIKGTTLGATSNTDGYFELYVADENAVLIITATNIERLEWPVKGRADMVIAVKMITSPLDEVVFKGYYSESKRLSTGAVAKVNAVTIEKSPVSNVLQSVQGRIPGVIIEQSNGYSSSNFRVQIRGKNSITFDSDPLYVVDGVPLVAGEGDPLRGGLIQSGFPGPANGQSPLNSINPASIESIEVLKDADATAIYGSQGANGVVLITTKKAKAGKTAIDINMYSGFGKVTRMAELMNTGQYLQMRKEAFANDQIEPDIYNAPDLLVWDQNRNFDWQDYLIGGTATTNDAQISLSGGDLRTQVRVGAGYHHETTVFPGDQHNKRGSAHLHLTHKNTNERLLVNATINYSANSDNYLPADLTSLILLPPNAPAVEDSAGGINWKGWEPAFYPDNLAGLRRNYRINTSYLTGNLRLEYLLFKGLTLKMNGGYTEQKNDQFFSYPAKAANPAFGPPSGSAAFGNTSVNTWIIEPQAEYSRVIGQGKLQLVGGGTFQENISKSQFMLGIGYANDALLENLISAPFIVVVTDNYAKYRYNALFGRVNYNWKSRYLLNLTARRDGSSRFGPGNQFANFAAIGAGWIFSEETFVKNSFSILSFGKIRGSFGTAGSANIGDYKYLSQWQNTANPYLGSSGFYPTSHLNTEYRWEKNKKLELALELGLLKDRISLSASWYKNKSSNQLIGYNLPNFTGFGTVTANFPAVVQNAGWEFLLNTININSRNFKWSTSFNIGINKNKLLAFPNLETSSYNNTLVIGQPLNVVKLFHYNGVDPQTGSYTFEDLNKDGIINGEDYVNNISYTPKFLGGLTNTIQYKNLSLDVLFQFVNQRAPGINSSAGVPGQLSDVAGNQPVLVLSRWQQPGDVANIAKFTTISPDTYIQSSDYAFMNASFIRLKNISLTYTLPGKWMNKIKFNNASLFVRAQNLATISKYKGIDPETQTLFILPH